MSEQEMRGGKFLPAFFVDEVKLNETFLSGTWPLHITLFPPVRAEYTGEYGEQVRRFVNPVEPFDVVVGASAFFGPDEDIYVRKIESSSSLQTVHQGLVKALAYLTHDPTYRLPYNPHITLDKHDARIERGDVIWVEGMSIVAQSADSREWRVVDKMRFKGVEE